MSACGGGTRDEWRHHGHDDAHLGGVDGTVRAEREAVQFPSLARFRIRLDELHDSKSRARFQTPFSGLVVHGGAGYHSRANEAKHRSLLEQ
jgi:hypothetical protein